MFQVEENPLNTDETKQFYKDHPLIAATLQKYIEDEISGDECTALLLSLPEYTELTKKERWPIYRSLITPAEKN